MEARFEKIDDRFEKIDDRFARRRESHPDRCRGRGHRTLLGASHVCKERRGAFVNQGLTKRPAMNPNSAIEGQNSKIALQRSPARHRVLEERLGQTEERSHEVKLWQRLAVRVTQAIFWLIAAGYVICLIAMALSRSS